MSERIRFRFDGALASVNQMNFYEAARFQYAAARLFVKLAQFRDHGRFVRKISAKSNVEVNLSAFQTGSFNMLIDASEPSREVSFVDLSLAELGAFVLERLVAKQDEKELIEAIKDKFPSLIGGSVNGTNDIDVLVGSSSSSGSIPSSTLDAPLLRRLAERDREAVLANKAVEFRKIDFAREQKLVAMAAPLVGEMATALRRSAKTLEVISESDSAHRQVLFLDEKLAAEIETAVVESEVTPILCDIVQFNKDNGWGKARMNNGATVVSFSIPSDILRVIRQRFIDSMKVDKVYLQTYIVRDRGNQILRLIVVGLLDTPST